MKKISKNNDENDQISAIFEHLEKHLLHSIVIWSKNGTILTNLSFISPSQ